MKTYTLIILAVVVLFNSCNQSPKPQTTPLNNVPDTIGYYSARDLKGLGYFILGQSTFKGIESKVKAEMRKEPKYMTFISEYDSYYPDFKAKKGDSTVFYQNPIERSILDDDAIASPSQEKKGGKSITEKPKLIKKI